MDVFVLSSVAEGMPRVILEAMAAGVPCIGTNVGGIPEVICNKDVGCVVPSKDSEALAQAMISVANLPNQELETLVGQAQAQVREFYSHDVTRAKLAKLYEAQYACSQVAAE